MQEIPSVSDINSAVSFMRWALGFAVAALIAISAYFTKKVDKKDDQINLLQNQRTDDAKSYREGSQEGLHIIKGMAEMLSESSAAQQMAQSAMREQMQNLLIRIEKYHTKMDTLIEHFVNVENGGRPRTP